MGQSQAAKAKNHERIVGIGAARIRERGFAELGLADLMAEAGLTVGGFYRHFESRDALLEESLQRALAQGSQRIEAVTVPARPGAFDDLVAGYLSPSHRDDVESSCAVAVLANETARAQEPLRDAYSRQVEHYLGLISDLSTMETKSGRRKKAVHALTAMVGALVMARAVNDPKLSGEILRSAAQQVRQCFG